MRVLCLLILFGTSVTQAAQKIVTTVTQVAEKSWEQRVKALGTLSPEKAVRIQSTVTEKIVDLPFRDGDRVKAGDVLVVLEKSEEEAAVTQAQARLTEQLRELRRIESLVNQKTLPSAQLDEQRTRVEDARASLAINEARVADRVIKAPFDGVLGLREYSRGALLTPGDTITTLDQLEVMHLDFAVPERVLGQILPGQKIFATAISFPGQVFPGEVIAVDTRVDVDTRTTRVRARVQNSKGHLRSGMLMNLELVLGSSKFATVPEEAVFQLQRQHFVFRIDDKGMTERVTIEVDQRRDGMLAVTSGLKAGDRIVATGTHRLRPGMLVEETK